jgi:hypothetical protein
MRVDAAAPGWYFSMMARSRPAHWMPHAVEFHRTKYGRELLLDAERCRVAAGVLLFTRPGELRPWDVQGLDGACLCCRGALRESASRVVRRRLTLEAKRLLARSELRAAQVGFEDPAYFARFFRRAAGEPPMAFRARAARARG